MAEDTHEHTDSDGRQGKGLDVDMKPGQRDQPPCHRGPDIGPVHNGNCLRKIKKTGIDKTDCCNGYRA